MVVTGKVRKTWPIGPAKPAPVFVFPRSFILIMMVKEMFQKTAAIIIALVSTLKQAVTWCHSRYLLLEIVISGFVRSDVDSAFPRKVQDKSMQQDHQLKLFRQFGKQIERLTWLNFFEGTSFFLYQIQSVEARISSLDFGFYIFGTAVEIPRYVLQSPSL